MALISESMLLKTIGLFSICTLNMPLEILKMRMMTGKIQHNYASVRNCLTTVMHKEGLSGFWKGNLVSLVRILPNQSINYAVRKRLQSYFPSTMLNNMLISIAAGLTASTLIYPTDILRQILGNTTTKSTQPIYQTVKNTIQKHGYKYFFKGYPTLLMTISLYRACYNGAYDTHKSRAQNIKQKAIIAYLCTMYAEYAVYPFETVRRRRIAADAPQGFIKYGTDIWRQEGIKGFYKGASLLPLVSISWAATLLLFDTKGIRNLTPSEV